MDSRISFGLHLHPWLNSKGRCEVARNLTVTSAYIPESRVSRQAFITCARACAFLLDYCLAGRAAILPFWAYKDKVSILLALVLPASRPQVYGKDEKSEGPIRGPESPKGALLPAFFRPQCGHHNRSVSFWSIGRRYTITSCSRSRFDLRKKSW